LYLMLRGLLMIYGLFKALWYNLPRYGHRDDDDDDDGDSNDGMRNDGPLPIDCILVQNPPSIPLLLVAYLRCRFSGFSELLGGFPFGKNNNKNNHQQQHGRPGLIIDWHNLGYTMFEGNDVLVDTTTTTTTTAIPRMTNVGRIVKEYERQMSKLADGHLYVTHAMERWVNNEFLQLQSSQKQSNNDAYHERGAVLHDRPPSFFQPIENYNNNNSTNSTVKNENKDKTQRQHDILCQLEHVFRKSSILAKQLDGMNHPTVSQIMDRGQEEEEEETMFDNSRNTLFTTINSSDMKAELKPHRPWLIVSSTSWTPDEDFSILMNALILLDSMFGDEKRNQNMSNHNNNKNNNIRLIVIITGKGPLQSYYQRILESSPFPNQTVQVLTPWLKPIEYPLLISIADIGICLHVSTSGLCLPMKVLDMFGCHIPVLARSYATIREELVYDGKNGRVFENAVDLVDCLVNVLNLKVVVDDDKNNNSDKRNKKNTLSMMRMDIASRMKKGWDENWIEFALPVLLSCCSHNSRSRHSTGKDKFV